MIRAILKIGTLHINATMEAHQNPYLDARREWNERYGSFISQKRVWQVTALSSIIVNAVLAVSLVYQASKSSVQPFIVEVDKLGQAVAVAPADEVKTYDERIVRNQLGSLINYARSVTPDHIVQKKWLGKLYAALSPEASEVMNAYFKENDPFKTSKTSKVTVEVISALPLSPESWQLQWEETRRGLDGRIEGRSRWQGVFEIVFVQPKTAKAIMENPTGLKIKSFSWTQQM